MRRSTSADQDSSTPASEGPDSRLSINRPARVARSSSESTAAFAKRSSTIVLMTVFYSSRAQKIHYRRGKVRAPRPHVEYQRRRHEAGVGAVALLGLDRGALGVGGRREPELAEVIAGIAHVADGVAKLAHLHFAARVEHARDPAGVTWLDLRLLLEDLQLQPPRVDLHGRRIIKKKRIGVSIGLELRQQLAVLLRRHRLGVLVGLIAGQHLERVERDVREITPDGDEQFIEIVGVVAAQTGVYVHGEVAVLLA